MQTAAALKDGKILHSSLCGIAYWKANAIGDRTIHGVSATKASDSLLVATCIRVLVLVRFSDHSKAGSRCRTRAETKAHCESFRF